MVVYESPFSQMTNSDLITNSFIYGFPRWSLSKAPGARFSKVPIINGLVKLLPFTLKTGVSVVLHLT